jgi:hypothetical protein
MDSGYEGSISSNDSSASQKVSKAMPDSQCSSTELQLAFRPIVPNTSLFNPKALALAQEAKDEVTRSTVAYEAGVRQVSLQNRCILHGATTAAIQAVQVVHGLG